jgi:hypothetical protein
MLASQPLLPEGYPSPPAPEAFHGLAGDIVRAIDPHTEADSIAVLVQVLVAFGSVIGRTGFFVAEADRHFANLFVALVGETSKGRKGSSWSRVKQVFDVGVDSDWARHRVQSGLSSGEGLIWAVRDPVTKVKKDDGLVVDAGVTDKRLLVIQSELASMLRVLNRDGNTLSATIRQAWDTGRLQTLVKTSPAQATGAHVSIVGHITREELQRYLNRTEIANGFANRFLWLCVRRSKILPRGGDLREVDLTPLRTGLSAAIKKAHTIAELSRNSDAEIIWDAVYGPLSEGKSGLFGAVIGRAEAQVMRLATVYALLDCSASIKREHLLAALALWDYAEASARYIFGENPGDPIADELWRAIHAAGPVGLSRTQIRDVLGRNRKANEVDRALGVLLERDLVHRFGRDDTGGRPAEIWIDSTTLTTDTTKEPVHERVRSFLSFKSYLDLGKAAVSDRVLAPAGAGEDPAGTEII